MTTAFEKGAGSGSVKAAATGARLYPHISRRRRPPSSSQNSQPSSSRSSPMPSARNLQDSSSVSTPFKTYASMQYGAGVSHCWSDTKTGTPVPERRGASPVSETQNVARLLSGDSFTATDAAWLRLLQDPNLSSSAQLGAENSDAVSNSNRTIQRNVNPTAAKEPGVQSVTKRQLEEIESRLMVTIKSLQRQHSAALAEQDKLMDFANKNAELRADAADQRQMCLERRLLVLEMRLKDSSPRASPRSSSKETAEIKDDVCARAQQQLDSISTEVVARLSEDFAEMVALVSELRERTSSFENQYANCVTQVSRLEKQYAACVTQVQADQVLEITGVVSELRGRIADLEKQYLGCATSAEVDRAMAATNRLALRMSLLSSLSDRQAPGEQTYSSPRPLSFCPTKSESDADASEVSLATLAVDFERRTAALKERRAHGISCSESAEQSVATQNKFDGLLGYDDDYAALELRTRASEERILALQPDHSQMGPSRISSLMLDMEKRLIYLESRSSESLVASSMTQSLEKRVQQLERSVAEFDVSCLKELLGRISNMQEQLPSVACSQSDFARVQSAVDDLVRRTTMLGDYSGRVEELASLVPSLTETTTYLEKQTTSVTAVTSAIESRADATDENFKQLERRLEECLLVVEELRDAHPGFESKIRALEDSMRHVEEAYERITETESRATLLQHSRTIGELASSISALEEKIIHSQERVTSLEQISERLMEARMSVIEDRKINSSIDEIRIQTLEESLFSLDKRHEKFAAEALLISTLGARLASLEESHRVCPPPQELSAMFTYIKDIQERKCLDSLADEIAAVVATVSEIDKSQTSITEAQHTSNSLEVKVESIVSELSLRIQAIENRMCGANEKIESVASEFALNVQKLQKSITLVADEISSRSDAIVTEVLQQQVSSMGEKFESLASNLSLNTQKAEERIASIYEELSSNESRSEMTMKSHATVELGLQFCNIDEKIESLASELAANAQKSEERITAVFDDLSSQSNRLDATIRCHVTEVLQQQLRCVDEKADSLALKLSLSAQRAEERIVSLSDELSSSESRLDAKLESRVAEELRHNSNHMDERVEALGLEIDAKMLKAEERITLISDELSSISNNVENATKCHVELLRQHMCNIDEKVESLACKLSLNAREVEERIVSVSHGLASSENQLDASLKAYISAELRNQICNMNEKVEGLASEMIAKVQKAEERVALLLDVLSDSKRLDATMKGHVTNVLSEQMCSMDEKVEGLASEMVAKVQKAEERVASLLDVLSDSNRLDAKLKDHATEMFRQQMCSMDEKFESLTYKFSLSSQKAEERIASLFDELPSTDGSLDATIQAQVAEVLRQQMCNIDDQFESFTTKLSLSAQKAEAHIASLSDDLSQNERRLDTAVQHQVAELLRQQICIMDEKLESLNSKVSLSAQKAEERIASISDELLANESRLDATIESRVAAMVQHQTCAMGKKVDQLALEFSTNVQMAEERSSLIYNEASGAGKVDETITSQALEVMQHQFSDMKEKVENLASQLVSNAEKAEARLYALSVMVASLSETQNNELKQSGHVNDKIESLGAQLSVNAQTADDRIYALSVAVASLTEGQKNDKVEVVSLKEDEQRDNSSAIQAQPHEVPQLPNVNEQDITPTRGRSKVTTAPSPDEQLQVALASLKEDLKQDKEFFTADEFSSISRRLDDLAHEAQDEFRSVDEKVESPASNLASNTHQQESMVPSQINLQQLEDRIRASMLAELIGRLTSGDSAISTNVTDAGRHSPPSSVEVKLRDLEASLRWELDDIQGRCLAAMRDSAEAIGIVSQLRRTEPEISEHRSSVDYSSRLADCTARIEEHEFRISTLRTRLDLHDNKLAMHDRAVWSSSVGAGVQLDRHCQVVDANAVRTSSMPSEETSGAAGIILAEEMAC